MDWLLHTVSLFLLSPLFFHLVFSPPSATPLCPSLLLPAILSPGPLFLLLFFLLFPRTSPSLRPPVLPCDPVLSFTLPGNPPVSSHHFFPLACMYPSFPSTTPSIINSSVLQFVSPPFLHLRFPLYPFVVLLFSLLGLLFLLLFLLLVLFLHASPYFLLHLSLFLFFYSFLCLASLSFCFSFLMPHCNSYFLYSSSSSVLHLSSTATIRLPPPFPPLLCSPPLPHPAALPLLHLLVFLRPLFFFLFLLL